MREDEFWGKVDRVGLQGRGERNEGPVKLFVVVLSHSIMRLGVSGRGSRGVEWISFVRGGERNGGAIGFPVYWSGLVRMA